MTEVNRVNVQPVSPTGNLKAPKDIFPAADREFGPYEQKHIDAAVKIQARFRGYLARKHISAFYRMRFCSDDTPLCPADVGLGQYAEVHVSTPYIKDDKRYGVRDKTAKQVLVQLGCPQRDITSWGFDFQRLAQKVLNMIRENNTLIAKGVLKQMKWVHHFPAADCKTNRHSTGKPQYLLGPFDCIAIPCRADYDDNFEEIKALDKKSREKDKWGSDRWGGSSHYYAGSPSYYGGYAGDRVETLPDCDSPSGFSDWFWVLHAAAPNIGETANADDFPAYSKESGKESAASSGGGSGSSYTKTAFNSFNMFASARRLDEDLYVADMARLWRITLSVMGNLKIQDAIYFPFGMGAFLRCLGQNDPSYDQPEKMRNLRRRLADELMAAIADICIGSAGSQGPTRIHLCLMCSSAESVQNHNCFVEAAAVKAKKCSGLSTVLHFRKNVDAFQLAHELATSSLQKLKVCVLNGANRALFGNHWFQSGARTAIDENLHRRSSSLARAALLLNLDTRPRERGKRELADTLAVFKMLAEGVPDDKEEDFHVTVKPHMGQQSESERASAVAGHSTTTSPKPTTKEGTTGTDKAQSPGPESATQAHADGSSGGASKSGVHTHAAEKPPAQYVDQPAKTGDNTAKKGGCCGCCSRRKPSSKQVQPEPAHDQHSTAQQRQGGVQPHSPPRVSPGCCCFSGGGTVEQTGRGRIH